MNLPFERVLRHKNVREAADAGLLIWRENFIVFIPLFAVPFWVCAFLFRLLPGSARYLSWAFIWLLKPLFDRIILHIISIRFFDMRSDIKRLYHGLGKTLLRGLLGDLLWRRFSPMRSVMMPVRILETGGRQRQDIKYRKGLLKKGGLYFGSLLTLWGISVEIALLLGEALFFIIMAEFIQKGFFSSLGDLLKDGEIYIFALWCFNLLIIESLYVCMGFSVYINSRIEVEGWDLEILFRNFARKAVLVVIFVIFLISPAQINASENDDINGNVPLEKLHSILDSPDFGGEQDTWGIRLKKPIKNPELPDFDFNPVIAKLRQIFAYILRIILILLIAGLLFLLLYYFQKTGFYKKEKVSIKGIMNKQTVHPDSLLQKAEYFYNLGNVRLAWGMCYSAAVISLSLYRGISFPPNTTESECIKLTDLHLEIHEAQNFKELIQNWILLAYADRAPDNAAFDKAISVCRQIGVKDA
jgi:hypothetical protein